MDTRQTDRVCQSVRIVRGLCSLIFLNKMLHAVPIAKLYCISYPHHDVWFIGECWANL